MNEAMSTDEHSAAQKMALANHYELIGHIQKQFDMIKSTPEGFTPDVATFFENVLDAQERWLASHGILFPGMEGGGQ